MPARSIVTISWLAVNFGLLVAEPQEQYVCQNVNERALPDITNPFGLKTAVSPAARGIEYGDIVHLDLVFRREPGNTDNCNLYMTVFGEDATSPRKPIPKSELILLNHNESRVGVQYGNIGLPKYIQVERSPCIWLPLLVEVTSAYTGHRLELDCAKYQIQEPAPVVFSRQRRSAYRSMKVKVKTSGSFQAGTDATITMSIEGTTGSSGRKRLSGSFERGDWDTTSLYVGDIGIVTGINIGHNDAGFGAGWKLDRIEIVESGEGTYKFGCDCWIEGRGRRNIRVGSRCSALKGCTSQRCVTCDKCEGTVSDAPGWRAFRLAGNRRECTKLCSWRTDSVFCYPGHCADELPNKCQCAQRFSGHNCLTMEEPLLLYNEMLASGSGIENAEAPIDFNDVTNQEISWTNMKEVTKLKYIFKTKYIPVGQAPKRPAFVDDYSVGIIRGEVKYKFSRDGSEMTEKSRTYSCPGVSESQPSKTIFKCEAEISSSGLVPSDFKTGDIIAFTFSSTNGGYVKIRNKENNSQRKESYRGQTKTVTVQLGLDYTDPYHCKEKGGCEHSMLTVPKSSLKAVIPAEWDGWKDDMAGIDYYELTAFDMAYIAAEGGVRNKKLAVTAKFNNTLNSGEIRLPDGGLYALEISAFDKAGNSRTSRRIMIYESDSKVETTHDSVFRVTSAAEKSSWDWQWTSDSVTLEWDKRYINLRHFTNKWLEKALPVANVDDLYDDHDYARGIDAIPNVQAIVEYRTAYLIDHNGGETILETPDDSNFTSRNLAQSHTITPPLVDGDTLRYWIRAYDFRREYLEENVTVHIDTSPPIIENLWLTREDRLNVSVHRIEELNTMTIEWESYDDHSGLETVMWRVFDNFTGEPLVHGIEHLTAQGDTEDEASCEVKYGTYPRGANCYCTPGVGCYHRHYQVKPKVIEDREHGGIFHEKNKGVHDYDYFLEVTVMNHAKLTTTLQFQITVDSSAPHTGFVHDGKTGDPEVDYQDSIELHANWDGFFDKESGVKFYQYGFDDHCLDEEDFGLTLSAFKINETYSTHASWTAPSAGKFYITVVAYNRALEPSSPVCSDGVTIDQTKPILSQIAVENSRTSNGLVTSGDGKVWLITADRRRSMLSNPDDKCRTKATKTSNEDLELIPRLLDYKKDYVFQNDTVCTQYDGFSLDSVNLFYIFKEHKLYVNWTCFDEESGIHDYELGLMSNPSNIDTPDIQPFTSTHHHPHYQKYHPGLSEGEQFYIVVKAINRAGLTKTEVLGPVTVHTQPAVFKAPINVILENNYLIAKWTDATFTDPVKKLLKYEIAIGSSPSGTDVLPFIPIQTGGSCSASAPPSCTAVYIADLHWDLHHSHTYYMSVKVTNVVGLWQIAVSEPYSHDVRLPSFGVVFDVSPKEERELFDTTEFDDSEYLVSTSTLDARWYGFDDHLDGVTYSVGLGTAPGKDDVRAFVDAGEDLSYRFEDLNLAVSKKYFVTVAARNDAGEIKSSSDGVTVIKNNVDIYGVTVYDGPVCDKSPTTDSCSSDVDYQVSTSLYMTYWTHRDHEEQVYHQAYVSIEKQLPTAAGIWRTVRDYQHVGHNDYASFGLLSLEPGHTYRAAVKFCAVNVCTNPVYSDGVTVIPHPPVSGGIQVTYSEIGEQSRIQVNMDRFRDPDVKEAESYDVMDRYEWSLTDNSHNSNMLIHWTPVDSVVVRGTKVTFVIQLPSHLTFTKCRRIAVRGFTKAGTYTTLSTDVKNCNSVDPALITPSIIIDAVGSRRRNDIGRGVKLRMNARWNEVDADYTPYTNVLSAVWPTLRHHRYKWAVIAGEQIDPRSHYKMENIMKITDPCSIPNVIKCGYAVREFVNVEFRQSELLKHGQRFYICIHAGGVSNAFEKWRATLEEINVCSDGITVDLTPPSAGTVTVSNLHNGFYQQGSTEVALSWDGFTDVEESGVISHNSGISHYQVALGSMPDAEDVRAFSSVGQVNKYTFTGLTLQNGHILYATVRAIDFVNQSSQTSSEGFVIDSTPPDKTDRHIQYENRYVTSLLMPVCWKGVLVDQESGIKHYDLSVGTSYGESDVITNLKTENDCYIFDLSSKTSDGHTLFVTIKAHNKAGLYTIITSHPLSVDTSPPGVGHVFDGKLADALTDAKDKDYVTSPGDMGAHWEGFADPHSQIDHFKVKVGTCEGCEDIVPEYQSGARSDAVFEDQHHVFAEGIKYYVTVTACNKAGLCSSATSDGVILDQTPPIPGRVMDGTLDRDIQYQASRKFLGCKWHGFEDAVSGLDYYEWRIGTTPGGNDSLSAHHAALEEVAFHTLPTSKELPVGQKMYCTVRAYNKAGLYTDVASNGFIIDNTPPVVVKAPGIMSGQGSLVALTLLSRTTMRISWEMKDEESFIEKQYISISSHQLGEFDSSLLLLPGLLREFTYTKLQLHDGSNYTVKVTACNMAGLCTSADTGEMLLDSSAPSTGMLAVHTDHAARLTRHQPNGMTWTGTSLNLAWLGFADLHSGIDHYIVIVGSTPFAADIMKHAKAKHVQHDSSGVDKEDEGVVQVFTIETKPLKLQSSVFVAVWAVNGVGLKSRPLHSKLILGEGGQLELVRRCTPFNCEGHCVCAVQDKKCAMSDGCSVANNGGGNAIVTVNDVICLTSLDPSTAEDVDYSPSDTFLAATWKVTTKQGRQPIRYEYSVGKSDKDSPKGIFTGAHERVWHDAPVKHIVTVPLVKGKELTPGLNYCVFVRAWYDNATFSIFKSDGVLIDNTRPKTTDKTGKAVKELKDVNDIKDVDYQSTNSSIHLSWEGKFLPGQSGLLKYRVYVSTSPGGHSIHGSSNVTYANYTVNNLSMTPSTAYFSSILAYDKAELVSWTYSDGVVADVRRPVNGVIQDGDNLHDSDFQPSLTNITASWFDFSDTDSTIIKYFWCVGTNGDTEDCSLMDWEDVGLHTSARTLLDKPLSDGTKIWTKVYAVDAVGHKSNVSVSDGLTVDASPPEIKDQAYLADNLVSNPSFEEDEDTASSSDIDCNHLIPTAWEAGRNSCIKVITPDAPNAKHGKSHIAVSGSIYQTVTGLEVGRTYLLTVHTGYPETLTVNHKAVEGSVSIGQEVFTFSLDPRLCKGVCQVDEQSSILWSTHKYKFVANNETTIVRVATASREMEIVLDHVTVQAIEYSKNTDTMLDNIHLSVHSVFLTHWSSLHAIWHFEDKESPIVEYTWAVGTVPGGTQIQKFVSVGRHSHGTLTGLRLTHNEKLYLTITARNAAGLITVSHPDPITVDMTPPEFSKIIDGKDSDVDYLKVGDMYVEWKAGDDETDIERCDWAIGTTLGSSDIKMFEIVPSNETTAMFNFNDVLNSSSLKVFTTVRCFNWVGLMATATTNGVSVIRVDIPPKTSGIQMLGDEVPYHRERGACHTTNRVRLHWEPDNVQPTIVELTDAASTFQAKMENHFEFVTFSGLHVKNRTTYNIDIYPETIPGVTGERTHLNYTIHGIAPEVVENSTLKMTSKDNHMILSWPDVFISSWKTLHYEVNIGTVQGGTDVVEKDLTKVPEIKLTLSDYHKELTALHISVMAIDPCGYSTHFTQTVDIN